MNNNVSIHIKDAKNPHQALYTYLQSESVELAEKLKQGQKIENKFDLLVQFLSNLKTGFYHDFLSDGGDLQRGGPKMMMVNDLREISYEDLAQLVIDGVFDESTNTDWKNEKIN